ncbi:LysM peptidoglycan-binding and 3D domain-containing protein [Bacillus sp. EB600]|uniref:3D domain-containing protein n=1 Tax=Bacillus sp. EB600 TaxID=2806345 RepID=UPI00210AFBC5|nr:LysM peptidoglycan-binding and 3D domain-containing protein [Bacillus sp. EB600]MCQ6280017.1 LysM peptidoglycan-binding domain-containing protein [Bacillus sp. EB600]
MFNKMKTLIAAAVLSLTVSANVEAATVTVHKGDTLWDLSRVHNTSVENIQKLNHLTTDLIHPGDILTIASEKHYTVKQGDTLWDIAMAHHISVSQLMEWNNLMTDLIHPGLNLLIFDDVNTTKEAVTEKATKPAAPTVSVPSPTPEVAPAPQPAAPAAKPATPAPQPAPTAEAAPTSKEITVKATAYTASCEGCSGITATGVNIKDNPNEKVIAVDPSVIPLGSKVYVEGYGEATAADTGGAIKGNRIDIFIPSEQAAVNFGVKQLKVTILN